MGEVHITQIRLNLRKYLILLCLIPHVLVWQPWQEKIVFLTPYKLCACLVNYVMLDFVKNNNANR